MRYQYSEISLFNPIRSLFLSIIFSALLISLSPLPLKAGIYQYKASEGLTFSWQTDDKVGITTGIESYGYTEQLCFWASSTQGSSRNIRSLYATGYQLKDATRYYSYLPYKWTSDFTATAISLTYTGQKQSSNGSTAHLWPYDYCASEATPANDACTFSFHHLGAFLRITFVVPEGTPATENLSLSGNIPTSATLNLKSQGTAAELTLEGRGVLTTNLTGLTTGSTYTAYIAIPKVNLTTETIALTLGNTPIATIKGFNAQPGYLYNIDLTPATTKGASGFSRESEQPQPAKGVSGFSLESTSAVATPLASIPDIPLDPTFTLEILPQRLLGDVNNDGTVDVIDVITLNGYYLSGKTSTLDKSVCDLNNDGQIDVIDVIAITSKYLTGK